MMTIDDFRGDYAFLSNFHVAPVTVNHITYPTVEHAFQACKTVNEAERRHIAAAPTPGEAKRRGRHATLRADWDEVRITCMRSIVWCKFTQHPDLAEKLLATGDATLIEGNWWHDKFWGVCEGKGQNWLGILLMETRERLRRDKE
jgi:ribA/ribD-fused uncharacterized protein